LVYCDRCGAKAGRDARYCKICGNTIVHPPFLWRIRRRSVERASTPKAMEPDTRRLTRESIEHKSATDRTTKPSLNPAKTKLGASLVQVEQTQRKQQKQNLDQEELLAKTALTKAQESYGSQALRIRKGSSTVICYAMLLIGTLSLGISIIESSTILAFIGLGISFWGALLLFIRPQHYVRTDLMDSTALSSLKTIDRVMLSLGYVEKGVYIPASNPEKAILFIPAEPFSRIPKANEIEDQTFIRNPKGLAMVPPGLSLANLIEHELGAPLKKYNLRELGERLPKVLIENLEIAQDFEMHVEGDGVRFKFVDSIYSFFCNQLRSTTKVSCSMGCPICSAMACILAIATDKPVSFEEDKYSPDGKTLESSYRILEA
jgi:hypothetical protein